jgi:hypothetical protein
MRCRREFYAKHPEAQPTSHVDQGEVSAQSNIYTPDEAISLSLEYFKSSTSDKEVNWIYSKIFLEDTHCIFKNILFPGLWYYF